MPSVPAHAWHTSGTRLVPAATTFCACDRIGFIIIKATRGEKTLQLHHLRITLQLRSLLDTTLQLHRLRSFSRLSNNEAFVRSPHLAGFGAGDGLHGVCSMQCAALLAD